MISSGRIGSDRGYFYEHTLRRWPDQNEYQAPIRCMTKGHGSRLFAVLRWLKYLPQRLRASAHSAEVTDGMQTATQTFVLLTVS